MTVPMWLLRDGEVLAAAEVADSYSARARGLLGRSGYEGALLLPRTRAVHSLGMRFAIDVAFLDAELCVVDAVNVPPWRLTRPRLRSRSVLEAESGAFERWRLRPGDRLELHQVP
ncbi:MAG: DUF192 domain-containing protein [Acidimicrobiales bacterium]